MLAGTPCVIIEHVQMSDAMVYKYNFNRYGATISIIESGTYQEEEEVDDTETPTDDDNEDAD